RSACISSWQLPQVVGSLDLFGNAFSFQEMEPPVVANYAAQISRLETEYVVSLNSRAGKPLKAESSVGVQTPVTSQFIAERFADHGYTPVARLGRPAAPPQAELLLLRRTT
ncbi:MAG: putative sugar O-methyltransferase, partial [Ilumatobacter sp.]|uniref:putative sugar O-methyltransferase n=1 Tax=Ilumatobacter sp. TaxID=1967498 RepID=UPI003C710543